MASEHEEVDPIKSNPNSHKAVGVVLMLTILAGLAVWLHGSPFSSCPATSNCPSNCDADSSSQMEPSSAQQGGSSPAANPAGN